MEVCLLNARSLVNKLSVFMSFVYSSDYSVICCTETWLSEHIFDNEIIAKGYCIYRKDRGSRGGGVLIAVKVSIPSIEVASPQDLEVVTVTVGSKYITSICVVYAPPSATDQYHSKLVDYLTSIASSVQRLIIVGDFNLPDICWSSLTGSNYVSNAFCEFVFMCNLSQVITTATHSGGNILDLVLTSDEELIGRSNVRKSPLHSDHSLVSFELRLNLDESRSQGSRTVYDYKKADWENFCNFLLDEQN